ncbi:CGNR zinc finger domain-containing protein [Nocardioides sp. zg-DK7169]|uniref:CGNR zinc finger domain-containing protein n=1 Tax=Nocardioides sp. zg-DK7169 TaxID=2736600 RepID=UPI001556EDED|nr:CGNR zinc finger domain-containing protein [Nocardioides sp. zg-DK7169]NPC98423.1 CGNR zinc finger domain-containing protein [Nocardioides sp. zg-DK7169]
MPFAHDTAVSLQTAAALANSALAPDTLTTVEDLDDFYAQWEYTGRRDGTRAELDDVRALRPRLRALLTADRDTAVELVNAMLRDGEALPQLVRHDTWDWHLHAVSPDAPLVTRICVETAMAMIDVIRGDEMNRLGICADEDCEGIVVDLSRNRSKRFCSVACGNRNAVAAYRARQSSLTTS